jgi:hypothetical protein
MNTILLGQVQGIEKGNIKAQIEFVSKISAAIAASCVFVVVA